MPRSPSQNTVIRQLDELAGWNAYRTMTRKNAQPRAIGVKKFYVDVEAKPVWGKGTRVFEVEATVTNNTIFKSLTSLLHYLRRNPAAVGYLVVPKGSVKFATECLDVLVNVIRHYSKRAKGRFPEIPVHVISFTDVSECHKKVNASWNGGKVGQPPKVHFLPRC